MNCSFIQVLIIRNDINYHCFNTTWNKIVLATIPCIINSNGIIQPSDWILSNEIFYNMNLKGLKLTEENNSILKKDLCDIRANNINELKTIIEKTLNMFYYLHKYPFKKEPFLQDNMEWNHKEKGRCNGDISIVIQKIDNIL